MSNSSNPARKADNNWSAKQAYVLALICLVLGLASGYFLRGSGQSAISEPAPGKNAATAAQDMPGAPPSAERMKHMADEQAKPLLAQLANEPSNPELLAKIGNIYYDAQQFQEAISYYDRSLKVDPRNANVRTDRGTAYFYLGDSDRAITELENVVKTDPKHAQTMFNLGIIKWQANGDAKGAVQTWEQLLKAVPDYPERGKVEQLIARAKQHTKIAPGTKTDKPAS
jgi:cytochrome c-type biogenesis protein CcmH/NrfG